MGFSLGLLMCESRKIKAKDTFLDFWLMAERTQRELEALHALLARVNRAPSVEPSRPPTLPRKTFLTLFPKHSANLASRLFDVLNSNPTDDNLSSADFVAGLLPLVRAAADDEKYQAARLLFCCYDLDGSGGISRAELLVNLSQLFSCTHVKRDTPLSPRQLEQMVEHTLACVSLDASGEVPFAEFARLLEGSGHFQSSCLVRVGLDVRRAMSKVILSSDASSWLLPEPADVSSSSCEPSPMSTLATSTMSSSESHTSPDSVACASSPRYEAGWKGFRPPRRSRNEISRHKEFNVNVRAPERESARKSRASRTSVGSWASRASRASVSVRSPTRTDHPDPSRGFMWDGYADRALAAHADPWLDVWMHLGLLCRRLGRWLSPGEDVEILVP